MISLLILSCGTNANWLIVKTLREKFPREFRLIGTDTNPKELVAVSALLDAFYTVPVSKDTTFLSVVEDIIAKERPGYIFPSFDFDQLLFPADNDMLMHYGVKSLSAPKETLKYYIDKGVMYDACLKVGVPVPRHYEVTEVAEQKDYFIKPIRGVGSIGARMMLGCEIRSLANPQDFIIEEVCRAPERTLECFFYNGRMSCVCRDRIATKSGVCTKTRVYKSPRLEAIAHRFAASFKVPMIFNLQFMENPEGQPVVTDVNLRTAGGMGLSFAAGWDEVSAFAKVLLGRTEDDVFATLPEYVPEQFVVRTYDEKITQCAKRTVAFDLDGTLLDSRERHQIVMDEVLKRRGIALDVGGLVAYKSANKNNVDYLVSKGIDVEIAREVQNDWIREIESRWALAYDCVYADAMAILAEYEGWHRILVTARSDEMALHDELARLSLRDWFDEVIVVAPGKSASKAKATVLREKKVLVFWGDTVSDRDAAAEADVQFKFHENGFHNRETVNIINRRGAK